MRQGYAATIVCAADTRQNAAKALNAVQPCPSLLQSASHLWQPQQQTSHPRQTLGQQTLPQQPIPHKTSIEQSAPQPEQQSHSAAVSLPVLPPLPESQVSVLRQQARLRSLHLTDKADEEEGARAEGDKAATLDAERGAGGGLGEQGCFQIPAGLQVCFSAEQEFQMQPQTCKVLSHKQG